MVGTERRLILGKGPHMLAVRLSYFMTSIGREQMAASKVVRTRKKGQITIPDEFRRALGIGEDTLLRVSVRDGELRLAPVEVREREDAGTEAKTDAAEQGSPWLRELYEYFAPVREEIVRKGYTEEEVNADIDEAIREVRAERRGR